MEGYWKCLNSFKIVKYVLLDNYEIEIKQIHMTDNM